MIVIQEHLVTTMLVVTTVAAYQVTWVMVLAVQTSMNVKMTLFCVEHMPHVTTPLVLINASVTLDGQVMV